MSKNRLVDDPSGVERRLRQWTFGRCGGSNWALDLKHLVFGGALDLVIPRPAGMQRFLLHFYPEYEKTNCYPPWNYITGISMERNWVLYWLNATALSIILKQKHTTKYLSSCWMALFLKAMWDKEKSKSGLQIKISCIWTGWLCRSLNKRQHFLKE